MVKIIGHRGAAGYALENTLESFQAAIDIGCDRAELDVRLSKDNELIVIHDKDVARVTNGTGLVAEMTLVELQKLNCHNNQKLLTLQEVFDFCKNKINLQIELKADGTPQLVHKLILEYKLEDSVVITSFDANRLKEIKLLNPKLKVGLLFYKYSEEIWESAEKIPLDYICPKFDIVTPELINKAHQLGKTVYVWGTSERDTVEKLIVLGIDEVGTDFPKLFINHA